MITICVTLAIRVANVDEEGAADLGLFVMAKHGIYVPGYLRDIRTDTLLDAACVDPDKRDAVRSSKAASPCNFRQAGLENMVDAFGIPQFLPA
jgi:hypothetical protein